MSPPRFSPIVRFGAAVLLRGTGRERGTSEAKELSTLQALCGDRCIFGGTGCDEREFEAMGMRKAERGARTDEALRLVPRLLAGDAVTFDGRFTTLHEVEIGPAMSGGMPIWVAGGSQLPPRRSDR